jgi:membrane protease YdiL (CAAX protease family)
LWFGLFLYLIATFLYRNVWPFMPDDGPPRHALFSAPKTSVDYALMVPKFAANGFAEELVTRAYLISRLEVLLHSRASAVILAAACFTSYHIYAGFGTLLFMFLFGLTYGGMYLLLRRIWPLALGHMLISIRLEL